MLYGLLTTGREEACKLLIERNVLVDCMWRLGDFMREPILRAAIQAGQLPLSWEALEHANIWPPVGEDGRSKTLEILGLAAYCGSVDIFKQILSHCAVSSDPEDPAYNIVLMSAVQGRHPETVQLFLEAGFDVNGLYPRTHEKSATLRFLAVQNPQSGDVPLMEESVTLARLLLRHGANGGHRSSALQRALVDHPANTKYLGLLLTKVSIHDPRLQDLTH
ncbi:hypothetical protein BO86DRAFT_385785 [Aspergillus japonicus CBS 114.51]|uniref:Ankyrin n=1 Tax=Aspergillus japonicus CBS 114.51 TaxID=1448312 RepID=A0A8T8XDF1_ASPJA|nr:hypothetical protein BO86DRAFT_385785 [Aspergillus japonicus CBS 114.51]RAH86323.1 hypothetical protein BO86DRAFT_385785 [Aspergillus japonicus CBS 114.51]